MVLPGHVDTYVQRAQKQLTLLEEMWRDPRVQCYNDPDLPNPALRRDGSVFLAGPTSRNAFMELNWRSRVRKRIRQLGFQGFIYVPECRGAEMKGDIPNREYVHHWESSRLTEEDSADIKAFWIPRDGHEHLGLNTNLELGIITAQFREIGDPNICVIGWPHRAMRMGLPHHYARVLGGCPIHHSFEGFCRALAKAATPRR